MNARKAGGMSAIVLGLGLMKAVNADKAFFVVVCLVGGCAVGYGLAIFLIDLLHRSDEATGRSEIARLQKELHAKDVLGQAIRREAEEQVDALRKGMARKSSLRGRSAPIAHWIEDERR